VRLALDALLLMLLTGVASAQVMLDAKGRRHQCLPGDWSCSVVAPPRAPLQSFPDQRRPRPTPPKIDECGSRCDLLDRMK
jgi:hypothetical protein